MKNLSNVSCKVGLYTPQATGLRWYQFRPWDFGKFEPDELKEITLIYQVDNSSEGGTFDFDVTFVVYPSEWRLHLVLTQMYLSNGPLIGHLRNFRNFLGCDYIESVYGNESDKRKTATIKIQKRDYAN